MAIATNISRKFVLSLITLVLALIVLKIIFDKKHESYCLDIAIRKSNAYLRSKGFHEADDKSWQDKNGNYPNAELEKKMEIYMTNIYNKCIDFK